VTSNAAGHFHAQRLLDVLPQQEVVVAVEEDHAHAAAAASASARRGQPRVPSGRAEPGEEGVAQHEQRRRLLTRGHEAHGALHAGRVAAVQVHVREEEGAAHRAGARPGVPAGGT
jgi:hypothetical protein